MRRSSPLRFFALWLVSAAMLLQALPPAAAASAAQQLEAAVDRIIANYSTSKTEWSVAIRGANGESLYEKKSLRMLVPASNRKLFTSALALHTMGPRYQFRTTLYAAGEFSERGHLRGDLVLAGSGDPTFGNLKFSVNQPGETLEKWAGQLAQAGFRFVHRDLIVDCSAFAPDFDTVTELPEEYLASYNTRPSAFPLFENCVAVRIAPGNRPGSPATIGDFPDHSGVTLINRTRTGTRNSDNTLRVTRPPDSDTITVEGSISLGAPSESRLVPLTSPALAAGHIFAAALTRQGINLRGSVKVVDRRGAVPGRALCSYDSPPLAEILQEVNRHSNNFCAEQIYLAVSRRVSGQGSYLRSSQIELKFLDQIGINPQHVRSVDGSGLSRANLCSADSIVRLLTWARTQQWFDEFKDSLAVAGKTGTLRRRLGDKRLLGRVYGKTGTLNRVSCLSGYYFSPAGKCYIFSMLVNEVSPAGAITAQNKILEALARYDANS